MNNLLLRRMLIQQGGSPTPPTPYDAEVEYLISNGAYINTGIIIDSEYTIECEYFLQGTIRASTHQIYGSGANYYSRNIELYTANPNRWELHYDGSRFDGYAAINENYKVIQNKGHVIIYNSDSSINTDYDFGVKTFTCPCAMTIFANNRNSIYVSPQPTGIKMFRMIDGNNNVVCDYKAVRSNGVGYMYDSVSQTLKGSANANLFIIGPDIN